MLTSRFKLPICLAALLFLAAAFSPTSLIAAPQPNNISLNGPAASGIVQMANELIASGASSRSLRDYEIRIIPGSTANELELVSTHGGSTVSRHNAIGSEIAGSVPNGPAISGLDFEALYLAAHSASDAGIRDLSTLKFVSIYWPTDVDAGVRYVDFTKTDPPLTTDNGKTVFHCDTQFGFVVNLATAQVKPKKSIC